MTQRGTCLLAITLFASLTTISGPVEAAPADVPLCSDQKATIVGTAGDDHIEGTEHHDVIVARGGNDVVHGLDGNDLICGGPGNDRLLGADGNDELFGQRGDDTVRQGTSFMCIPGGCGNPVVKGGPGDDLVTSSGGGLDGGDGDDTLRGGRGNAGIRPGKGDDDIDGGPGNGDYIDFGPVTHGMRVNLAEGRVRGQGRDTIRRVEHVSGTQYDDVVVGNKADNRLDLKGGDDRSRGRGGE
jgi:Ca2+-binding RTX toxin-like protein